MWEKLIPKVKLRLNMYNSCLIQLLFTKKNNFFTKFSSNFELSIKFTQIKKVRFIDVIIPLRSVSTNVSNCIVLNKLYHHNPKNILPEIKILATLSNPNEIWPAFGPELIPWIGIYLKALKNFERDWWDI